MQLTLVSKVMLRTIIFFFALLLLSDSCYAVEGKITIIIDPQYGGKVFGPIRNKNLKAKDIVLKIAKELDDLFKNDKLIKIILTRENDSFISQEERVKIVKLNKGDFFISIGVNSSDIKDTKGIEIFYFNPFKDKKNSGEPINKQTLQDMLKDLVKDDNLFESIRLAKIIHKKILEYTKMEDRGIKSRDFDILKDIEIPSILIMIGYITNQEDGMRLADESFKNAIAKAIYEGIIEYLKVKEENEKEQK